MSTSPSAPTKTDNELYQRGLTTLLILSAVALLVMMGVIFFLVDRHTKLVRRLNAAASNWRVLSQKLNPEVRAQKELLMDNLLIK